MCTVPHTTAQSLTKPTLLTPVVQHTPSHLYQSTLFCNATKLYANIFHVLNSIHNRNNSL